MTIASSADLRSLVTDVAHLLVRRGCTGYLVGGYVRDLLQGRTPRDVDIAVGVVDSVQAAHDVARELNGSSFVLDAARGHARVLAPLSGSEEGVAFDFTPLHENDIAADLARRDFTVNAMALPLPLQAQDVAASLIDPFQGRADLDAGLVRAVSEENLRDDPLRLLRAVRVAGEMSFRIEPGTADAIAALAPLLEQVSSERVRDELCYILSLRFALPSIREMDRLNLLTVILPELAPTRGVEQPREHYWDVFNHLLETVGFFERLADPHQRQGDAVLSLVPWDGVVEAYFNQEVAGGRDRRTLVKLACLMHDVAKPQTKTFEPSGRMRFFGHGEVGAEMTQAAMERLRFARREIAFVSLIVNEHLRPMQLSQAFAQPTRRALYRYYRDVGDAGLATVYLSLADTLAARGPLLEMDDWHHRIEYIAPIIEAGTSVSYTTPRPSLVDGHVLMRELGLQPGPELGRILDAVQEAEGAGEVTALEEALALARRLSSEMRNERHGAGEE